MWRNFSEISEIEKSLYGWYDEHSGTLRTRIGVIELFPGDPAWKIPKTDEIFGNIFPENHRCNREITVHFFEFDDFR